MSEETIFRKIINKEIPADIVYQDDFVTAFRDISPQAPVHILIVPNKLIATVNDIEVEDEVLVGKLYCVAKILAKQEGVDISGYRLIMNCNQDAGQEVYHIHLHLLGGKNLGKLISVEETIGE
ncbi:HIT domain-containing protein [Psychromonas sp. CD1]|uniref:HIT domain-containing protein n=1 Tax=Psychromonas sp. CD1 TaxID=1979839 RepID=UPI000B9B5C20|nr:HIT domain-containing protein [Psychromonas sp. CD1]